MVAVVGRCGKNPDALQLVCCARSVLARADRYSFKSTKYIPSQVVIERGSCTAFTTGSAEGLVTYVVQPQVTVVHTMTARCSRWRHSGAS
jgi:hypothetical protein